MVHELPLLQNWPKHKCYYRYSEPFVTSLAETAGYKVISLGASGNKVHGHPSKMVQAALVRSENVFIGKRLFLATLEHPTQHSPKSW